MCSIPAFAIKGCKLNGLGQNICTQELALYKKPGSRYVYVVYVNDHKSSNRTDIKLKEDIYLVNRDLIIGNTSCNDMNDYCKGAKAELDAECSNFNEIVDSKILMSFENDMSYISYSRSSTKLVKNSCLRIKG